MGWRRAGGRRYLAGMAGPADLYPLRGLMGGGPVTKGGGGGDLEGEVWPGLRESAMRGMTAGGASFCCSLELRHFCLQYSAVLWRVEAIPYSSQSRN